MRANSSMQFSRTNFSISTATRQQIIKRIHPNTLRFYELPDEIRISRRAPLEVLNSRRLDVIARIFYAEAMLTGYGSNWGRWIYEHLMNTWTRNFTPLREVEPGRFTMQDYFTQFNALITSIASDSFCPDTSIVPTCKGTLVDGAHRIAAAIAAGIEEIATVELTGEQQIQNHRVLTNIGMERSAIEAMVLKLVRLKPQSRVALLFPCASARHAGAIEQLEREFLVDYSAEVIVTRAGLNRIMDLCYGAHEWWGEVHASRFTKRRYRRFSPLSIVFFQDNGEPVRPIKEQLRNYLGRGVDGIHTVDTHAETIALAETLLNENSVRWLNNARRTPTPRFNCFLQEFKRAVSLERASDQVCIDSGGVLAAYGLRDVSDLDYLQVGGRASFDSENGINCHNGEYFATGINEEDIVTDPRNHFYCAGLKFAAPHIVARLKHSRGSRKDLDDIARLASIDGNSFADLLVRFRDIKTIIAARTIMANERVIHGAARLVTRITPAKYHSILRSAYIRWSRRLGK